MKKIKTIYYMIEFLYSISLALFGAILYIFMEYNGYSVQDINIFMMVFWCSSFLFEIPTGVLSDTIGRKKIIIFSCLFRGLGLLCLCFGPINIYTLIFSGLLTAYGEASKSGTMLSWVIEELEKINYKNEVRKIISISSVGNSVISLIGGFIGAQVLGIFNLSYPIILSTIILFLTAIIAFKYMPFKKKNINKSKEIISSYSAYFNNFKESIALAKANKTYLSLCYTFIPTVMLTYGPFYQWQIFYQVKDGTIISGYIFILITLFSSIGVFLYKKNSKIFSVNALILNNIINCIIVVASSIISNKMISIIFLLMHIMVTSGEEMVRSSVMNENIKSKNRNTLLSLFYTLESLFTVIVIVINTLLLEFFTINESWFILAIFSIFVTLLVFLFYSKRYISDEK